MNISEHITYKEATRSRTATLKGISNIPNEKALSNMRAVALKVFEPIRAHFKRPIYISSFYRSPKLNVEVGGSTTSQHCKGEAMDIDCPSINAKIFNFIKDNLTFHQLIWEYGDDDEPDWVHVSYVVDRPNKKEVLKAVKIKGKTQYIRM